MGFFTELAQLAPGMKLTMHLTEKDGVYAVSVLPDGVKGLKSLDIKGTAAELDEGFIEAIKEPIGEVKLAVVNMAEFREDLKKKVDEEKEEAAEEQPSGKKPSGGGGKKKPNKKKAAVVKKAEPVKKNAPAKKTGRGSEESAEEESGVREEVKKDEGPSQMTIL